MPPATPSATWLAQEALLAPENLEQTLRALAEGQLDVSEALERLQGTALAEDGEPYVHLDLARLNRTGLPEVIFGQGKSAAQIASILERLVAAGQQGIATRVSTDKAAEVCRIHPEVRYHETARVLHWPAGEWEDLGQGEISVICAGTSDRPVSEEAAVVAELFGNRVQRLTDVGVAGIHRILSRQEILHSARVHIVVAGMEGALASVVAGLSSRPIIAVPTSVGYGASFQGIAALLGMLNSCASGVSVVNIDNGFGAAAQATLINRLK